MKITERLALLKAGYTKDEINAMIDEEAQAPAEEKVPTEAEVKADDFMKVLTALADEVKGMKKAIQTENIENTKMGTDNPADSIDKILQSLINPIETKEEETHVS